MKKLTHALLICRKRAVVLVIVMWVAMGLVSMALYFGNTISLEYRAADNFAAGLQAAQAIQGAQRYIKLVLAEAQTLGAPPSIENADYEAEQIQIGPATVWMVGREPDANATPSQVVYGLIDESSKLNINNPRITQQMLEGLPGMTPDLAATMINWRTTDTTMLPDGAQEQDYLTLKDPYNMKKAKYETPEELRLLLHFDMSLVYGEDLNRNGVLDANENDGPESRPPDDRDGKLDAGLIDYVTTFSDGQVNVRSAPWQVLACLFLADNETGLPDAEQLAQQLVAVRSTLDDAALQNTAWLSDAIGAEKAAILQPYITTTSRQYSADLVAVGHDGHGFHRALAVYDIQDRVRIIYRRDLTRFGWPLGSRATFEQYFSGETIGPRS